MARCRELPLSRRQEKQPLSRQRSQFIRLKECVSTASRIRHRHSSLKYKSAKALLPKLSRQFAVRSPMKARIALATMPGVSRAGK